MVRNLIKKKINFFSDLSDPTVARDVELAIVEALKFFELHL